MGNRQIIRTEPPNSRRMTAVQVPTFLGFKDFLTPHFETN